MSYPPRVEYNGVFIATGCWQSNPNQGDLKELYREVVVLKKLS
jgi:hypothetical protein